MVAVAYAGGRVLEICFAMLVDGDGIDVAIHIFNRQHAETGGNGDGILRKAEDADGGETDTAEELVHDQWHAMSLPCPCCHTYGHAGCVP